MPAHAVRIVTPHGDFHVDDQGLPLHDRPQALSYIAHVDLDAWRAEHHGPRCGAIDLLDIGFWMESAGELVYEPPAPTLRDREPEPGNTVRVERY